MHIILKYDENFPFDVSLWNHTSLNSLQKIKHDGNEWEIFFINVYSTDVALNIFLINAFYAFARKWSKKELSTHFLSKFFFFCCFSFHNFVVFRFPLKAMFLSSLFVFQLPVDRVIRDTLDFRFGCLRNGWQKYGKTFFAK
jgi:hypothetical protein